MLENRKRARSARVVTAASALVSLVMLSACASGGGAASADADKGVLIGVSFWSQDQKRYPFEAGVMAEQAKKNGDEIIVNYADNNAATQAAQVDSMIQRGIKVLVLVPLDPKASAAIVTKAQGEGVKVIVYDAPVTGAKPDYMVGRDNAKLGEAHAEAALKAVPTGTYGIIRGDEAAAAAHVIGKPYDDKILTDSNVKVAYDKYTPGWSAANAQTEAEAALQKNPDTKALVVMWDEGAQAAVSAAKAAGKQPGDVFITGTDASTPSLAYIAQGWQGQTVWTPIDEMARRATDIAHAFGTEATPPAPDATVDGVPQAYVNITSVTKSNLCEFVTKIAPKGWVTVNEVYGKDSCG
ncbi:substrate-binding domain-containing protein [Arthrobacter sp. M4]|uniref:substrate-binding domain-containing protein n=1 Tax=Arthrobacter sp. M4 TaxID=218160 RepID=UPI001CDB491F|nr:substrate-binding domain-containing protein [Arthrobacter sp. M4]MCA4135387.1 substrate-binding domain-containing protein [Arthrobacter sp. M4]